MPTIADVARRAGVSTATVSYVINNGPRPVRAETRVRVLQAAQELGYKPNRLARGLARRNTRAIAIIVPNNADLFFAQLAHGAEDATYSAEFNLILCNSNQSLERELDHFALLREKRIDGIILITCGLEYDQLRSILDSETPILIMDREIEGAMLDTVVFDNSGAARQATEHLLAHGHTEVACLAGPRVLTGARQRVEGYRQALLLRGIEPQERLVRWADYTFEGGYTAAKELLGERLRPTAVFASNDEMGIAAIRAASGFDLRVPEDLAVVGMGDSFVGTVSVPRLTTVFTRVREMGRLGAEMLLERIHGTGPLLPRRIILETQLVVRESCGCRDVPARACHSPRPD